jgi:hypothetical protein
MTGDWKVGELPTIEVEGSDTIAACLSLSADAFVEFEDAVSSFWTRYYNLVTDLCYPDLDGWRRKTLGTRIYRNTHENQAL